MYVAATVVWHVRQCLMLRQPAVSVLTRINNFNTMVSPNNCPPRAAIALFETYMYTCRPLFYQQQTSDYLEIVHPTKNVSKCSPESVFSFDCVFSGPVCCTVKTPVNASPHGKRPGALLFSKIGQNTGANAPTQGGVLRNSYYGGP